MTTRWRPSGGGRDSSGDPGDELKAFLRQTLGHNHPDMPEIERMIQQCVEWNGEANDGLASQFAREGEEIEHASQAHDGTPASRARAAAHARTIATDASLKRKFPALSRIGNGY